MLNNPNWGKKTISMDDFIGWLETKNPEETFDYQDRKGECCVGQYMAARGVAWVWPTSYADTSESLGGHGYWDQHRFQSALAGDVLNDRKVTFGSTLERVKTFQKNQKAKEWVDVV